jgi:DNA-binding Lrp family transcriptional regulator
VKEIDGKFQKLLRIKESPLTNSYSDEVPYEIVGNKPSVMTSFTTPPRSDSRHLGMVPLDDVGHKIISELQKDGRRTFEELGKSVGYTGMAVKKRIKNLIDHGVIKVSALLNIAEMKMYAAVTMLEVESAQALNQILDRFRECPRVVNMFITLGSFNTIGLTVAEDLDTLQSVSLEKCSLRSNAGIRKSDFYPIGAVQYSTYLPVREFLAHGDRDVAPCRSNCKTCQRYQTRKCVGCPATKWYRGRL